MSLARWKGKVAVVTGASSGIGAAVARRLVEEGLQVAALARRRDRLEELSERVNVDGSKGRLHPVPTDMSSEEEIRDAFEWIGENLGTVSVLINNAGTAGTTSLHDGDAEVWKRTVQVNVLGLSLATREAVRSMRAGSVDGHVIHMNSIAGHQVVDVPGVNVYPASKFAVTALADSLRFELAALGSKIKITSISPGLVDTELLKPDFRNTPLFRKVVEEKQILDPEDIVEAIVYALGTPPHVQIQELTIRPVGGVF